MENGRSNWCKKITFFVILIVTLLPLGVFCFKSVYFHQINGAPQVKDGAIDLDGYHFMNRGGIPLDGE